MADLMRVQAGQAQIAISTAAISLAQVKGVVCDLLKSISRAR